MACGMKSGNNRGPFVCPEPGCKTVIKNKTDMPRHRKTHATEEEKEALLHKCPYENCNYGTLQRSNLNTHKAKHTGEKKYVCPDSSWCSRTGDFVKCGFRTSDPGSFTRHRSNRHSRRGSTLSGLSVSPEPEPGPSTTASPEPEAESSATGTARRASGRKSSASGRKSSAGGRKSSAGGRKSSDWDTESRRYSPYPVASTSTSASASSSASSSSTSLSTDALYNVPQVIDSSQSLQQLPPLSADAAFLFGLDFPVTNDHAANLFTANLPPLNVPDANVPAMNIPYMNVPAMDFAAAGVPAADYTDLFSSLGETFAGQYVDVNTVENTGFWTQADAGMNAFEGLLPAEQIQSELDFLRQLELCAQPTPDMALDAPLNDLPLLPAQCPPPQLLDQQLYQSNYGGGVNYYDMQPPQDLAFFNEALGIPFNAPQNGPSLPPAQYPPPQSFNQQSYSSNLNVGLFDLQAPEVPFSSLPSPIVWPEVLGNSLHIARDLPQSASDSSFWDYVAYSAPSPSECASYASSPSPSMLDPSTDAFLLPPLAGNEVELLLQDFNSFPPC